QLNGTFTAQFSIPKTNPIKIMGQQPYNHRAPWFDQTTRLYRIFDLLACHPRTEGDVADRRLPGQANINTIWDSETFTGLMDPQAPNYFAPSAPTVLTTTTANSGTGAVTQTGTRVPVEISPGDSVNTFGLTIRDANKLQTPWQIQPGSVLIFTDTQRGL